MKPSKLNYGIMHSIVGKNDGVSIVIDQTVRAMVEDMGIPLGNIYFLAAYAPSRFNTALDDVFWHKNPVNKDFVRFFQSEEVPDGFEKELVKAGMYAKKTIAKFVRKNKIDVIIAHNSCHPYNFTSSLGLQTYLGERRRRKLKTPKCILWWHDSFYERDIFKNPGSTADKFLRFIPGPHIDGIAFINSRQPEMAQKYFHERHKGLMHKSFFKNNTAIIPNTSNIEWDWQNAKAGKILAPPLDKFNSSFFRDIGLEELLQKNSLSMKDSVFLLQHTRVVPRKRIDLAIDFAFRLEKKLREINKHAVLIVSGASGDEQGPHKEHLDNYYKSKMAENPASKVFFIFAENHILSHRDIVVDKKYYDFAEIPSIIAYHGGIGTYFSETEGFGNNLLEMAGRGLPVLVNRYEIYKTDIRKYGFKFPYIDNCALTDALVEKAFRLVTDAAHRNHTVRHNLKVLHKKLNNHVIARRLGKLLRAVIGT